MLRLFFLLTHSILALHFARLGIGHYAVDGAAWDAGAIHLFLTFWFLLAAVGFWVRNVWIVTMATLALTGLSLIYLLIGGVGELSMRGAAPDIGGTSLPVVGGFLVYLAFGEGYAIYAGRTGKTGG